MREVRHTLHDVINRFSDEYKQRQALMAILDYAINETLEVEPEAVRHLELAKHQIASKITAELVMKH